MKKIPLWLDCDPGHDDAMAIFLAAFDPKLDLIGISTVAGNQTLEKTSQNAANLLSAIGKADLPLIPGQAKPILGQFPFCEEIHGLSGLDNLNGEPVFPKVPFSMPEALGLPQIFDHIQSEFKRRVEKINFVATGSLTNLALLILLFPKIKEMISITMMGGALGIGNTHPVAEFNIENDPEAARIVFESGIDLVLVPLEVTHTVLVKPEILQKIGKGTQFARQVSDLLLFFQETYQRVFQFESPPLHDPLAVYYLIELEMFKGKMIHVDIETQSNLSRGQTICDYFGRTGKSCNAFVCLEVDVEAFWLRMLAAIHSIELHLGHKKG